MRNWILVLGVGAIVLGISQLSGNLMPESDASQSSMITALVILGVGVVLAVVSRVMKDEKK